MNTKLNKEEYKFEGHNFQMNKLCGKQVCTGCGLVFLRNNATAWCVEKGCNHKDHPDYQRAMKRITRMFE